MPGESTITINTTNRAPGSGSGQKKDAAGVLAEYGLQGLLKPRPVPDLTDQVLKSAKLAQMLRLLSGRGRKSTFLTGPLGDVTPPALGR